MSEALVLVLTAVPISLGIALGYRLGLRRLALLGGPIAAAWGVGGYVVSAGLAGGWFQPFGLLTSIIAGIAASAAIWAAVTLLGGAIARRSRPAGSGLRRCRLDRAAGAAIGGAGGLFVGACVWLVLFLVEGLMVSPEPKEDAVGALGGTTWMRSLSRTANRGFVRHLPVVGSLGDELEATVIILNSDLHAQRELARKRGLDGLAELPSFKAIVENQRILDEIDSAGRGDLPALYRLQRNPLILAFFAEEKVQEAIAGLRPSVLAREIEAIEASGEGR